jgi:murein L,D-transpeptidase YafK
MMRLRSLLLIAVGTLSGCAVVPDKFAVIDSCLEAGRAWNYRTARCEPAASGPVNLIVVDKSRHWMSVYRDARLVREFRVALGRGGSGPKQRQGDGKVPEGLYRITAHNPGSAYHLSLRIGYPTAQQIAAARRTGVNPGGDIMIHGLPNDVHGIGSRHTVIDWTDGCVAVANREIEWLYRAVPNGTPVRIQA